MIDGEKPQDQMVSIILRLPKGLHRQLVEKASQEDRSLNGEIVHLLKRSLQSDPQN